ncbi:MAG: demethoxyubiquinone hydroxylase family protein, partial [Janthinobacterium lividum]
MSDIRRSSFSPRQPGDTMGAARIARMIRVDHAGEYGAERIYAGQLAVLGRTETGDILRHMKDQETVHKDAFSAMIAKRRVRPTA